MFSWIIDIFDLIKIQVGFSWNAHFYVLSSAMLAYFHKTTVNTGDSFFFFFFFSLPVFDFVCSLKIVWVVLVSLDSFICLGQTILRLVCQKACLSLIHGLSVTFTSNILWYKSITRQQSAVWKKNLWIHNLRTQEVMKNGIVSAQVSTHSSSG